MRLNKGMTVVVNKEIYRDEEIHERIGKLPPIPEYPVLPENGTLEERHTILQAYLLSLKPYRREYVKYATKGETGVVLEIFRISKPRNRVDTYVKVEMSGKIKTFRKGSLDVI
jgi:hypothetical protein